MSILFRQTNAVWVAFTLAVCLLEDFTPSLTPAPDTNGTTTSSNEQRLPAPGSRRHASPVPPFSSPPPPPPPSPATPAAAPAAPSPASAVGGSGRFAPPGANRVRQRSNRGGVSSSGNGTRLSPGDGGSSGGGSGGVVVRHNGSSSSSAVVGNGNESARWKGNMGEGGDDAAASTYNAADNNAADNDIVENLASFTAIPSLVLALAGAAWCDTCRGGPLLRARLPLAVPVALFAAFVWGFNGGAIVIGDKENHLPGGPLHLAQLAYMVAAGAALWGLFGREAAVGEDAMRGFMQWVRRRTGLLGFAAIVGVVALTLWRYTLSHPFIFADNRHYTFYIWRRFLGHKVLRSLLAPVYVFCGWLVLSRLLERRPPLWVLTYVVATALVLVPSPLIEPRYLTVPVFLAHLESRGRGKVSLLTGVASCVAFNAAIIFVFITRPFVWHDGSLGRFMW